MPRQWLSLLLPLFRRTKSCPFVRFLFEASFLAFREQRSHRMRICEIFTTSLVAASDGEKEASDPSAITKHHRGASFVRFGGSFGSRIRGIRVNRGEGFAFPLARSESRASPSAVGSVSRASGRNAAHTRAPHWRANRINTRADAYTHGGVETLSDEAVLPPAGDRVTWPPGRVAARSARAVLSRERRTQHQSETSRETGRRSHSLPGSACFLPPSLRLSLSFLSLSVRPFATRLSLALPFSPFLSRVVPRHVALYRATPATASIHRSISDPSIDLAA